MANDYLIEVEEKVIDGKGRNQSLCGNGVECMEQLTFEDIVGNMDYTAHSTAEKFLSNHSVTPTYAVEF